VAGPYAYVADGTSGVQVVDVSQPSRSQKVGEASTDGYAYDIQVLSNHLYVADGGAGVRIFDIATPTNPVQIGSFDLGYGYGYGYGARGIHVVPNWVYVAEGTNGIRILNTSIATSPADRGHFDTPGFASDLFVASNVVYVADEQGGLQILNFECTDMDSDGMRDDWEMFYFESLSRTAYGDEDNDGLFNLGEYLAGSDPTVADSDDDGMSDAAEIWSFTSPTNADSVFAIRSIERDILGNLWIRWSSESGLRYVVESTSDLTIGFTNTVDPGVLGSPPENLCVDQGGLDTDGHRFYRIRVKR